MDDQANFTTGSGQTAFTAEDFREAFRIAKAKLDATRPPFDLFLFTVSQWSLIRAKLEQVSQPSPFLDFAYQRELALGYLAGVPVHLAEDETELAWMYIELAMKQHKRVAIFSDVCAPAQLAESPPTGAALPKTETWRDRPPLL